jgi:CubicO group peptidase (beta-lactamase class C family)
MAADAIFRIASMAKLVTAVAVMTLVDKGQLRLDDEVTSFLPEYHDLVVVEGFGSGGRRVPKPSRPATIRELMAHTAGLAYNTFDPVIDEYERRTGAPSIGTGFDWAGLVVEAITGQTFDTPGPEAPVGAGRATGAAGGHPHPGQYQRDLRPPVRRARHTHHAVGKAA